MAEQSEEIKLAKSVQHECIEAAREGFQDASMSGLCTEGAIEAAIGAIQELNIEEIIQSEHQKRNQGKIGDDGSTA